MKQSMAGWFGFVVLALTVTARAEHVVQAVEWSGNDPRLAVVQWADGTRALRVRNETGAPLTMPIAVIEQPAIQSSRYALRGTVACQDVVGTAYLELWNHFANGGAYFSRTLAERGPMAGFIGTSAKRAVLVPFQNEEGAPPPVRLELNLVMPGPGVVEIGPLQLVDYAKASPAGASGWSAFGYLIAAAVAMAIIVTIPLRRRRTRREELRRMQALDSGG